VEMSKLYFRYGAMNCGKTTALLQVAYNYEEREMNVRILKPKVDSKGEDYLVSRIGIKRKVDYLINSDDNLKAYLEDVIKNNISCILIDEAQFLNKEQIDELFLFTKKYDTPVICYGLRSDFKTNAFPGSLRLFEVADDMEELYTICKCGQRAKFNGRKINNKFTIEGDQIAIDGKQSVTYESLCGKCYLEEVLKIDMSIN
jgi:thymidine kinase